MRRLTHTDALYAAAAAYALRVLWAVLATAPDIVRGEDGLEYGPLLLLGAPLSIPLSFVGALFDEERHVNEATLVSLIVSCVCTFVALIVLARRSGRQAP